MLKTRMYVLLHLIICSTYMPYGYHILELSLQLPMDPNPIFQLKMPAMCPV